MVPFNTANAFDLSHDHKLTCHMGDLVPVLCEEICPGDVWRWNADVLLRLMPMLAPMMHDVDVYVHCFYVPSRILFSGFEDFITGGKEGNDSQTWPYMVAPDGGYAVGSLADYLGLPTGVAGYEHSALPFRAVAKIYNDWYRDELLISEVALSTSAGLDSTTNKNMMKRCWHKDYFTSSKPSAQLGESVYLPLGATAPVVGTGALGVINVDQTGTPTEGKLGNAGQNAGVLYTTGASSQNAAFLGGVTGHIGVTKDKTKSGVVADLSEATAATINDIRTAFQIQRFLEKNLRFGYRYIEWLLSHFGVKSSDARLQRSEFLGGGRVPISVGEVLQTSSTDATSPQGNMAGRGISYQNVPKFTKYFEEFGYVVGFLSIIPKASYQQGLRRMWTRKDRFDYPLPVFSHLGMQAVKNKELYAQAPTVLDAQGNVVNEKTFGYQERYEELRRCPSIVCGQMKSSLNYWHLGRIFDSLPQLNADFVKCTPSKRIFAVTDADVDECIVQIHHNIQAIRRFPKFGSPGLIDHD